MSNDFRHDELIDLAFAVCDGTATDDQIATAEELIAADPAARLLYLQCMELHFEMDYRVLDSEAVDSETPPVVLSPSFLPSLSTTHYTPSTHFVGGPVFSYMVASVVLCAMLLGAWAYKITLSDGRFVYNSTPPVAPKQQMKFVARITGMADCEWADSNTRPYAGSYVSLGRKYELTSGLLEITYAGGARVILEGPCSYTVDSGAGGRLQLGRLVARVEKRQVKRGVRSEERGVRRVASGQWLVASAKPQAANPESPVPSPQSPAPLFSVTTPSAVVTDLGTEFGVEVGNDGSTISQVFCGSVRIQAIGDNEHDELILRKDDSVKVERDVNAKTATITHIANHKYFIREMPPHDRIGHFDLLDIVAGGNGLSESRERGIVPNTGEIETRFTGLSRNSDNRYHAVAWSRFIDGVFVPVGGKLPVQINSVGDTFRSFPHTSGQAYGSIWPRTPDVGIDERITDLKQWIYALGDGGIYMPKRKGLLGLHSNAGITFDISAICNAHQNVKRASDFQTVAGMSYRQQIDDETERTADIWVFVDGKLKYKRLSFQNHDGPALIRIGLNPEDRFLTLVATDSNGDTGCDWVVFGDPELIVLLNAGKTAPP